MSKTKTRQHMSVGQHMHACTCGHPVIVHELQSWVYCGVLRCVAVCCRVLRCVAVCCSVLQCVVAVCCSVLQCVAGVIQS